MILRRFSLLLIINLSVLFFSDLLTHGEWVWTSENGWEETDPVQREVKDWNTLKSIEGTRNREYRQFNSLQMMNLARSEQEKKEYRNALKHYKIVYKYDPFSVFAAEALYQSGKIYMIQHQYEDAFATLDKIIKQYPEYPKFNQVIGEQYEVACLLMQGKRPYYWGFIPGFRNYEAALKYFEGVVKNAPYSEYASRALMNLAELAIARDKLPDAFDALDRIINFYPSSDEVPKAYFLIAKTHQDQVQGPAYDQGATREAISYYEDFLILFSHDVRVPDVESRLAVVKNILSESKRIKGDFYYYRRNNPRAALVYYHEAITDDPNSKSAEKAREQIELIEAGVLLPKTPADIIFGRYKSPPEEDYDVKKDKIEDDVVIIRERVLLPDSEKDGLSNGTEVFDSETIQVQASEEVHLGQAFDGEERIEVKNQKTIVEAEGKADGVEYEVIEERGLEVDDGDWTEGDVESLKDFFKDTASENDLPGEPVPVFQQVTPRGIESHLEAIPVEDAHFFEKDGS